MEENRELYSQARKRSGNIPVVAHNSYLINLASPDVSLYEKSLRALNEEMERANFLGVPDLLISLLTLSPRSRVWISSVLVWDYGARL
jgi:deoxyribonuclease-4